jgi:hypothetical protein
MAGIRMFIKLISVAKLGVPENRLVPPEARG